MRRIVTSSVMGMLGALGAAHAEEAQWRAVPGQVPIAVQSAPVLPPARSAVSLGAPVALPASPRAGTSGLRSTVPAVTLARPVALDEAGRSAGTPPTILLTAFAPSDTGPRRSIVRAQNSDDAKPLPAPRSLPDGPSNPGGSENAPSPEPPAPNSAPLQSTVEHTDCLDCPPAPEDGECCLPRCCAPANRFYASADYLFWWMKGYHVPPLLTTIQPNTNPNSLGALGQPNTVVVFGDRDLGNDGRSGARFRAGYWLDECQNWGLDGSYFFLAQQGTRFAASSQSGVLSRPFFVQNVDAAGLLINTPSGPPVQFSFPGQFVETIALPGFASGSVVVASTSRLWGADINLRKRLLGDCCWRVDLLAGFRYLDLFDNLSLQERSQVTGPGAGLPVGTVVSGYDSFTTRNQFYGGQLGLLGEWRRGRWIVDARVTAALGDTQQLININGLSLAPDPHQGDLLALASNIGRHYGNQFSVVPEVGLDIGYQVTEHIRVHVGYNFLYWSNVVRPGDQIATSIDARQVALPPTAGPVVGTPGPVVPFKTTDFWAQGVNAGLEFIW